LRGRAQKVEDTPIPFNRLAVSGEGSGMTSAGNVHSVDFLIGRSVLSRATANKLGQTHDLLIDVARGTLAGLCVRLADATLRLVDYGEIYSIGPDAVMINGDESAVPVAVSPLRILPLAKNNLVGANVVTESGRLLGHVANLYLHLAESLLLVYEVRASLLDKLLGHALFFPASQGRAVSADFARIVVADDTPEKSDHSLAALAARLFGPPPREDPVVVVRTRGH
jgi:uncharacterized protein YrrD